MIYQIRRIQTVLGDFFLMTVYNRLKNHELLWVGILQMPYNITKVVLELPEKFDISLFQGHTV